MGLVQKVRITNPAKRKKRKGTMSPNSKKKQGFLSQECIYSVPSNRNVANLSSHLC